VFIHHVRTVHVIVMVHGTVYMLLSSLILTANITQGSFSFLLLFFVQLTAAAAAAAVGAWTVAAIIQVCAVYSTHISCIVSIYTDKPLCVVDVITAQLQNKTNRVPLSLY